MKIHPTALPEVLRIEPDVYGDDRGFFMETYHAQRYESAGINERFVQDNVSFSRRGVLRGLHFQHPESQGKLITVLQGEVFDVAVDIRRDSPTFCQWVGVRLSGDTKHQLYIPPKFAHGFLVLSETALFTYKCTRLYSPENDHSLRWNDPVINIQWPMADPVLSDKDLAAPFLAELSGWLPVC